MSALKVGGVVLCGGRSRRMGKSKAWLPCGGEYLLQRMSVFSQALRSRSLSLLAGISRCPPYPMMYGWSTTRSRTAGRLREWPSALRLWSGNAMRQSLSPVTIRSSSLVSLSA